ncbi:MAG: glycoside hydrolase family 78 protein [Fimbriimonadaceae bacterium]|nr:glycoside hydrolase family 78 protein [Fimbriimonadaceae bacterium]
MLSCLLVAVLMPAAGSLQPAQLRCEALANPVGVATATPRLSWKLNATDKAAHNLRQTGYRITVGSQSGKSDLWDTGKVQSGDTFGIAYAGKPLASGQKVWWRVQVFDQKGVASDWSAAAEWSVGLLKPSDWKAQWIGYDAPVNANRSRDPFSDASWIWAESGDVVYFKRVLVLNAGFTKATLRITADDQFSATINGHKVAESDGKTDAWRRPVEVDVTDKLLTADNTILVRATNSGGAAGLLAKLTVAYTGNNAVEMSTGSAWQVATSESGPFTPAKVLGAYGAEPWGRVGPQNLHLPPPRLLRHEFSLNKPVKRAILYGSALGLLDLRLNGKAVTDELFMPGWTDYTKRVYARGYDVTKALKQGNNAVGVVLGDGWYSGYVGYGGRRNHYGTKTRALVQLNVEYTDGTTQTIASGPDWKASTGPTLEGDFLMGEAYDARLEKAGWDSAGYSDRGWFSVQTGAEMNPVVEPFPGQPVRPYEVLKAKTVTEPKPGVYVLDLGQNLAGFARLKVKGEKGQKIVLRFAERLSPDGNIYTTNLRGARTIDTYICKGEGVETWSPKFTFHGFQYIEVTGLGHKPAPDEVVGIAISSDTPDAGTLETSDPMLNRLVKNAWWTQKMNFIDIPTDCPQRDERLGWTGDAQAYIRTATMLNDVQPFFAKWLVSLDDAQREDGQYPMVAPLKVAGGDGGPAWADAGVICPWTIYDVYGDKELLARHYPQMKKFIEFCVKRSTPEMLPPKQFHCFGDWVSINANTPNEVIYTAYFAGSARLLAQAASALGKPDEAQKHMALYRQVRAAFQKAYVKPDGSVLGDTQCSYILALVFDLLEPEMVGKVADRLVADIEKRGWHLSTGFVGTRDIMHVLSKIGRNDVAFRLLHNDTFPSWGFTIKNGATSIWERWDGWTPEKGFQDPGMNSFAHYAFGAVVGWMFAQPAGIDNLAPGFKRIKIAPQIDPKLTWLKSSYDSVRGRIVSEWSVKDGKLTMRVVIPPNTTAEIHVPATGVEATPKVEASADRIYRVGSGEYTFVGKLR